MDQPKNKKIEILENAVIVYSNGVRENLNAINITDKGVYTGHLINHHEYMEGGGIPIDNIKRIIGGKKRMVYKKNF